MTRDSTQKSLPTAILTVLFLCTVGGLAQKREGPPVTSIFAVFTATLDAQKATIGDEFVLRSVSDVIMDGQNIIPAGSNIIGHIRDLALRSREKPTSALAI